MIISIYERFKCLSFILLISFATSNMLVAIGKTKSNKRDNQVIEVKEGNTFTIKLEQNPSTGYSWQFERPYNQSYLQLVEQKDLPRKALLPGAPVMHQWVFKALKPGTTLIVLEYIRPWDSIRQNVRREEYKVVIKGFNKK